MLRHELSICVGQDKTNREVTIKCHDGGIFLAITLMVCRQVSKWRVTEEAFTVPAGATAVLKIAKPDKTKCTVGGKLDGCAFVFELPPQACTVAGAAEAEVSIYGAEGKRVTSATFRINVPEECVCNCEMESEPYIDLVGKQIQEAKDAEAGAKEAAKAAMQAQVNAPKIGANGNWFVWNYDSGHYVDTGVSAGGTGDGGLTPTVDLVEIGQDNNRLGVQIIVTDADGQKQAVVYDGKTPKKGVDYWTHDDKETIVNEVIAELPIGDIEAALEGIIAIQEDFIARSPVPISEEVAE